VQTKNSQFLTMIQSTLFTIISENETDGVDILHIRTTN